MRIKLSSSFFKLAAQCFSQHITCWNLTCVNKPLLILAEKNKTKHLEFVSNPIMVCVQETLTVFSSLWGTMSKRESWSWRSTPWQSYRTRNGNLTYLCPECTLKFYFFNLLSPIFISIKWKFCMIGISLKNIHHHISKSEFFLCLEYTL